MAAALGFDAPAILRERSVSEEMLPLEEPHEGVEGGEERREEPEGQNS